jgi:hypothetical protein
MMEKALTPSRKPGTSETFFWRLSVGFRHPRQGPESTSSTPERAFRPANLNQLLIQAIVLTT